MTFATELENKIRATYPAIYVTAREDWRCIQEVERVAKQLKQKSHVWSVTKGWDGSGKQTDPLEAVRFPAGGAAGVWILTNFHFHLDNAEVVQTVKDSIQLNKAQGRVFVFVSNVWKVPAELQDDVTRMEFGLPDRELLLERLDYVLDSVGIPDVTTKANRTREEIVEAALGMTTAEAENSFTLSLVEQRDVLPEVILREKAKAVAKSGILEFYQPGVGMEDVGGLDLLKAWLSERQSAFSSDARKYGLPEPKGILLIGPPGTGKSLVAKAVSAKWNFPLLRFDIGKVFQGLVGASEERTREALATASAVAPCIIWTDEIEKGLAGSGSNGATDSGVSARVFGTILSYMQERQRPVFWVATANQVQNLPPELLRAGRFDEIFSLDLPSSRARAEILSIHLARRRRAPAAFDLALVVQGTAQFSGAELEAVVVKALFRAFAAKREVTTEDLVAAAVVTIPLAVTRREDIQALRDWAKTRAVPASSEEWEQLAEPGKQRRIIVT